MRLSECVMRLVEGRPATDIVVTLEVIREAA